MIWDKKNKGEYNYSNNNRNYINNSKFITRGWKVFCIQHEQSLNSANLIQYAYYLNDCGEWVVFKTKKIPMRIILNEILVK